MTFWFKAFHGMAYDIQWKVIADALRTQPDKVFCVWFALLDYASMNADRGSIEGFDPAVCKAAFGYKVSLVEKIIDEMIFRGLLTDDNRIANWEIWQVQNKNSGAENSAEDESRLERERRKNRERQQRYRKRMASEAASRKQTVQNNQSDSVSDGVTDNAVTVTGNAESNATANVTRNASTVTDNALYRVDIDIEKNREYSPLTPQGERNVTSNAAMNNGVTDNAVTDNAVTPQGVTETPSQPVTPAQPEAQQEQMLLSPEQPAKAKRKRTDYRRADLERLKAMYPKQIAIEAAVPVWEKGCREGWLPEWATIEQALAWQTLEWKKDGFRYVPNLSRYLKERRWNDKPKPQPVFSGTQRPMSQRPYSGPDEMFYVVEQNKITAAQVEAMLAAEEKAKEQENGNTDAKSGKETQIIGLAGSGCELQQGF